VGYEDRTRLPQTRRIPVKFVVEKVDGEVWLIDGSTQKRLMRSVDALIAIQNALNFLTTGRTWKETVVLRGNLETSATIRLPSYVTLDVSQAKLTLKSGANTNMIENSDLNAGRFAFYTSGSCYRLNMDKIIGKIGGARGVAGAESCILISETYHSNFGSIYGERGDSAGLGAGASVDFKTCDYINAGQVVGKDSRFIGIELYTVRFSNFGALIGTDNDADGVNIHTNSYNLSVGNVIARGNGTSGLMIRNGCARINVVNACTTNNSQTTAGARSGIEVEDSTDCLIAMVNSYDDQAVKTQNYGIEEKGTSNYNQFLYCHLRTNLTAGYSLVGANSGLIDIEAGGHGYRGNAVNIGFDLFRNLTGIRLIDPDNVTATSVSTVAKAIRVTIGGVEYYIPCYTTYA